MCTLIYSEAEYSDSFMLSFLFWFYIFGFSLLPQDFSLYTSPSTLISICLTFEEEFLHIFSFYPTGIVSLDESKTKQNKKQN